jgi:hypothetical protein
MVGIVKLQAKGLERCRVTESVLARKVFKTEQAKGPVILKQKKKKKKFSSIQFVFIYAQT